MKPLCADMTKARRLVLSHYRDLSRKVHRSDKLVNDAGRTYSPKAGESNLEAKELAHILQGLESQMLLACIQYAGESVVLLQHDGFATSTRLNMAELRVAIRGVTGLDIDMEEKQL